MADILQAGGLGFQLDADISRFTDAMREADGRAREAGKAMGEAFERAGFDAGKAVDNFVTQSMSKLGELVSQAKEGGKKFAEAWAEGESASDAADKALTQAGDDAIDALVAGIQARIDKHGGIFGQILQAVVPANGLRDLVKTFRDVGAALLDDAFNSEWATKAGAKISSVFDAAVKAAGDVGSKFAEASFNLPTDQSRAKVEEWAEVVKTYASEAADGFRTALQRMAGQLDEVTASGQKGIDFLARQITQLDRQLMQLQARTDNPVGNMFSAWREAVNDLTPAFRDFVAETERYLLFMDAVAATGKKVEDLSAADLRGIRDKIDALMKARDESKKLQDQEAERQKQARELETMERQEASILREARREAEAFADAYDRKLRAQTEGLEQSISRYEMEIASIGKTAGEVAKLRAEYEALHRARRDNLPDPDPEMLEKIKQAAQAAADAKQQWEAFGQVGRTVSSSLESAFDRFVRTGRFSFKEMVDSMIQDLARLAFRMSLLQIFGNGGTTPGLFGNAISAAFGGFRAEGGPLEQGRWYVAGEHGPEPIWGGGPGAFAAGYGGGAAGGGTVNQTFRIEVSGAFGRQEMLQIANATGQLAAAQAVESMKTGMPGRSRSYAMLEG